MPMEFFLFIGVVMGCMFSDMPSWLRLVGIIGTYVGIRVINAGKAPGFVQHWIMYQVCQVQSDGRMSAAARARTPPYPFGEKAWRDRGFAEGSGEARDG